MSCPYFGALHSLFINDLASERNFYGNYSQVYSASANIFF